MGRETFKSDYNSQIGSARSGYSRLEPPILGETNAILSP